MMENAVKIDSVRRRHISI